MKKYFQMVLCEVKAMLVENKCQNAFWVGTLKTKDLKVRDGLIVLYSEVPNFVYLIHLKITNINILLKLTS